MQQQSHDDLGAYTNIFLINQAYQESRNSNTIEGREAAEMVLVAFHDKLRELHVKFHLAPIGRWVLDEQKGGALVSHYDGMC
jgi:hypothetical protein